MGSVAVAPAFAAVQQSSQDTLTDVTQLEQLAFYNINTGENNNCQLCIDGADPSTTQKSINYILRDWRSNEETDMDLGLLDQLYQLQAKLGVNKRINVISGYRSPRTNEMLRAQGRGVAKRSYHTRGQALDFAIPGVSLAEVRRAALSLKAGGVGYYPASGFVHIDTGPIRRWG